MKEFRNRLLLLIAAAGACLASAGAAAQLELARDRWLALDTAHFRILSQLSPRRSAQVAAELETWRLAVGRQLGRDEGLPAANVPNLVFLFEDVDDMRHFSAGADVGFHIPTPRANYMAMSMDEDEAWRQGLHHYVHFLLRNFDDLRLPRWYEEALAGYYSRLEIDGEALLLPGYPASINERMADLALELSMERLLYQDAALASPRLIQIANLKSVALLEYLRHGHEEDFTDRRDALGEYLDHLLAGRDARFAFDQSFRIRPQSLDEELQEFLRNTPRRRPGGRHAWPPGRVRFRKRGRRPGPGHDPAGRSLALNAGRLEVAETFFRSLTDRDTTIARAWSGLGDSLRYQDASERENDQQIAAYFDQALALAPDDPEILLDFGEYWEAELEDCDNTWAPARARERLGAAMRVFQRVVEMQPDNPEANLAMGQIHLFSAYDWRDGLAYQQRAFALLPADTFIMEQAAKYAIEAGRIRRSGSFDHGARPAAARLGRTGLGGRFAPAIAQQAARDRL